MRIHIQINAGDFLKGKVTIYIAKPKPIGKPHAPAPVIESKVDPLVWLMATKEVGDKTGMAKIAEYKIAEHTEDLLPMNADRTPPTVPDGFEPSPPGVCAIYTGIYMCVCV